MTTSKRIKGDPAAAAYYHVMSRTVADAERGGMMFFGAHEKNVFANQLRKHAEFAGIEVLTWCMMDNHFHVLIRVPARDQYLSGLMADGRRKFWKRLRALYSNARVRALRKEVNELERKSADEAHVRRAREIVSRFSRRMADISSFLRDLKHSFSVWFNRKHKRRGTLWMERFKSVLLEGEPWVLKKVAAYIDLNPIRAGMVDDPGDYRWSGYGQAVGGVLEPRRGLSLVYGHTRNEWSRICGEYRQLLYLEGVEVRNSRGEVVRAGVSDEDYCRAVSGDGRESAGKRMARQVRYFSDGAAIGSREFLDRLFERNRNMFGSRRKTGARRFRGPMWKGTDLFSLRDLAQP